MVVETKSCLHAMTADCSDTEANLENEGLKGRELTKAQLTVHDEQEA